MPEAAGCRRDRPAGDPDESQVRSLARGLSPLDLTAANFAAKLKEFAAGVQDIFSICLRLPVRWQGAHPGR